MLHGRSLSDVRRIRFLIDFELRFLTEFCGSGMRCMHGEARHVAVYRVVPGDETTVFDPASVFLSTH